MPDIYEQHDRAFASVSAYVIVKGGRPVARIALKHSPRGTRVTAFVHWTGTRMVKGHADGGGYDKASAAIEHAIERFRADRAASDLARAPHGYASAFDSGFVDALMDVGGSTWERRLHDAGFEVWGAV